MREFLKGACDRVFNVLVQVVGVANKLIDALHTIPAEAVVTTLEKADELVCDAIDVVFDAFTGDNKTDE